MHAAGRARADGLQEYASPVEYGSWMEARSDQPVQGRVRFASRKDPDLAPRDLPLDCINWTLTYQISDQNGQLAVSSTVDGSVSKSKC